MPLSREQVERYQRDGVLALPGAFCDWVELLRSGVDANLSAPGAFCTDSTTGGEGGRFFDDYCNWPRIDAYRTFAETSPCAAIASAAMDCPARLFHEHLVLKDAGTSKATPWHQDITYYCLDGSQTASIWIALDPVPLNNAVMFAAGSHLSGKSYFPRKFLDGRNYDYASGEYHDVPDIDAGEGGYKVKSWACEPGDAVLFNFRTLHGTNATELLGPRRAVAWRWIGDDVRFHRRPGTTSPPYPELHERLQTGDTLPADVFPVMHPRP